MSQLDCRNISHFSIKSCFLLEDRIMKIQLLSPGNRSLLVDMVFRLTLPGTGQSRTAFKHGQEHALDSKLDCCIEVAMKLQFGSRINDLNGESLAGQGGPKSTSPHKIKCSFGKGFPEGNKEKKSHGNLEKILS